MPLIKTEEEVYIIAPLLPCSVYGDPQIIIIIVVIIIIINSWGVCLKDMTGITIVFIIPYVYIGPSLCVKEHSCFRKYEKINITKLLVKLDWNWTPLSPSTKMLMVIINKQLNSIDLIFSGSRNTHSLTLSIVGWPINVHVRNRFPKNESNRLTLISVWLFLYYELKMSNKGLTNE